VIAAFLFRSLNDQKLQRLVLMTLRRRLREVEPAPALAMLLGVLRKNGAHGLLLDRAPKGLVHVNMATVSLAFAREIADAHKRRGLGYVAATVFGRPDAAAAGKLTVIAAGAVDSVRSRPCHADRLLDYGRRCSGAFCLARIQYLCKLVWRFLHSPHCREMSLLHLSPSSRARQKSLRPLDSLGRALNKHPKWHLKSGRKFCPGDQR